MNESTVIPSDASATAPVPIYPIYRKYKTGVEWQKIASPSSVIHITKTGTYWNVSFDTSGTDTINEAMTDSGAIPCSRDEFEKVYWEAHWTLTQIHGARSHAILPCLEDAPICYACGGSGEGRGGNTCCSSCQGTGQENRKVDQVP